VPDDLRYFSGSAEGDYRPEATWSTARFVNINQAREVIPGFTVVSTRSVTPGTREMNEISLMLKTPRGSILFVGCSHPGIEKILESATQIDPRIHSIFGGFHLVDIPDDQVTAMRMKEKWGIERMAAGHCTGQFAFAEMVRIYGDKFDHAGIGSIIQLPT
jgi:7,8-dihydropterin-6-yl-methyl-4-(beta-D-ribofuranosyl)aminobenzene 5'-phosphate synthase